MTDNKIYNAAVAFIKFNAAYKALTDATKALGDDLDLSESYPFFLLDFEEITPAVMQWSALHASKLIDMLPDIVPNPACITCSHFYEERNLNGSCITACDNYPTITFSRNACEPFMKQRNYAVANLTDNSLQLAYLHECETEAAKCTAKTNSQ